MIVLEPAKIRQKKNASDLKISQHNEYKMYQQSKKIQAVNVSKNLFTTRNKERQKG